VFELFEKRHFRCDCGTPKSNTSCLSPSCSTSTSDSETSTATTPSDKTKDNAENHYNQNFDGLYCWCSKPYDHDSDVTMFKCYVCEDWFHEQCIKKLDPDMPAEEDFDDFFCHDCMSRCKFLLHYYPKFKVGRSQDKSNESVGKTEPSSEDAEESKEGGKGKEKASEDNAGSTSERKRKREDEEEKPQVKQEGSGCKLKQEGTVSCCAMANLGLSSIQQFD
jgi:E3 ubiquitin-protein ligase UBR7